MESSEYMLDDRPEEASGAVASLFPVPGPSYTQYRPSGKQFRYAQADGLKPVRITTVNC